MIRPHFAKLPKNVEELAHWYMRYISPVSLVAAFLLDYFIFLRRVDLWTGNLLLFFYLVVAASCILVLNMIETGRLHHPWILAVTPLIPVAAQFAFGGLFSGYLSLYSKSAALETSWVFVLIIAALLVGNERFVRFYMRFAFQVSIFFTALFSFFIFFLPVAFHKIGPYMFVMSGLTSVGVITLFLYLLSRVVPEVVRRDRTVAARAIAVIFVIFNILYFTGAIPPLPLALKEAGVYHGVARDGDAYRLLYEPLPWYEAYLRYNTVFHRTQNEAAYVYTAVFAPTALSVTVFHQWQHYDKASRAWITDETIPFFVVGGRDGGYRGYSVKTGLTPGAWRVNVITEYGQIIGRVSFTAVDVAEPVPVESTTR